MSKGFSKIQLNIGESRKNCLQFIRKILSEIGQNQNNLELKQLVSQILEENLYKLDDNSPLIIRDWVKTTLPKLDSDRAYERALNIYYFSRILTEISELESVKKAVYIEIAIAGYEVSLLFFTKELFPQEWAGIQDNLGFAYYNRIRSDCVHNLEQAITAFNNALQVYTHAHFPQEWARIQNNLGLAYHDRIHGDWVHNLEQAITAFNNALQVYTHAHFPQEWAEIQNNLGLAYCDYSKWINFNKSENLELAILCYKNALQIYLRANYPQDWAMVLTNLGASYRIRLQGDTIENLTKTICCYNAALKEYSREKCPEDWAMVQMNLGNAYRELYKGNIESNLAQSIHHLNASLEVYNCEYYPQDWADIQHNLALTYEKQEHIDKALACLHLSLETYTHTKDYLECGCVLGNIAFTAQQWEEAIYGYGKAIDAVEQVRTWSNTESRRQEILKQYITIYQDMVSCCINVGQIDKALEYVERSRSKKLVDLMASYNLYQSEEISLPVQELLKQYEELQQQIDQEHQKSQKSQNSRSHTRAAWTAYNEVIKSLETAKQQVWENLRRLDPVLAGEIQVNPLSLSDIQKLIDKQNIAILSFYTTNSDTHIFVVRQNKINLHTCTGQGLETLQNWINQNWLLPYINDKQKWESQFSNVLHELAERLQISELISKHLQEIEELILVPHLLLHQIPFAALPTGEYQEHLIDKFLIRYTPSCQILEFCYQRPKLETLDINSLQYGTVEDSQDNLPFTRYECEQIAQFFDIPPERRLIGSNQATRKNYRQLAQQINVLHSSHHAESRLDNPLESKLRLADGNITLGELMTPNWRLPNLVEVFLACCETNLGTPSLTDDILTLSTGFLCAGANSVISSLCLVDDLATAFFSIFYYQERQIGKSRPESLQQAQFKLRELKKRELQEISRQAEAKENELIQDRNKYIKDSPEYEKWNREYNLYSKFNKRFNKRIKEIENSNHLPFSHPRYWAIFICHGLR